MDIYDQEISRLADSSSEELLNSWDCEDDDTTSDSVPKSPLFQFCNATGTQPYGDECIGCLTLIRAFDDMRAETPELTDAIRSDERLPEFAEDLCDNWESMSVAERVAALQPFAEWQRRLDVEIRGKKPAEVPSAVCTA